MARPKIIEHRVNVTLQLEAEIVQSVDKLAQELGMSRSRLMRNLVLSGWDDVRRLDAIGVFTLVLRAEEFMAQIRSAKVGTAQECGEPS